MAPHHSAAALLPDPAAALPDARRGRAAPVGSGAARRRRAGGAGPLPARLGPSVGVFRRGCRTRQGRPGGPSRAFRQSAAGAAWRMALARPARAAIPAGRALDPTAPGADHRRQSQRQPGAAAAGAGADRAAGPAGRHRQPRHDQPDLPGPGRSGRPGSPADDRVAPAARDRQLRQPDADPGGFRHQAAGTRQPRRPPDLPGDAAPAVARPKAGDPAAASVRCGRPGRSAVRTPAAHGDAVHPVEPRLRRRLSRRDRRWADHLQPRRRFRERLAAALRDAGFFRAAADAGHHAGAQRVPHLAAGGRSEGERRLLVATDAASGRQLRCGNRCTRWMSRRAA